MFVDGKRVLDCSLNQLMKWIDYERSLETLCDKISIDELANTAPITPPTVNRKKKSHLYYQTSTNFIY
jgi:hypothetical protein